MARAEPFTLRPGSDLRQDGDGAWEATGPAPRLILEPPAGRGFPSGWCRISLDGEGEGRPLAPVLHVEAGAGASPGWSRPLPPDTAARGALVRLPGAVRAMALTPLPGPGRFRLRALTIEPCGRVAALRARLGPIPGRWLRQPGMALSHARAAWRLLRAGGPGAMLRHALRDRAAAPASGGTEAAHAEWLRRYDTLGARDRQAIAARIAAMARPLPRLSVLLPLRAAPEALLRRAIASVRAQLWPEWELCLIAEGDVPPPARRIAEAEARADPARIRLIGPGEPARGAFVALLDPEDALAPHALYLLAEALAASPPPDLVFSDEDRIDPAGRRLLPWFKPRWNPELMLAQNAVGRLAAFRRHLFEAAGGGRAGDAGGADHALALRVAALTTPERIRHIPFLLYHRGAPPGAATGAAAEAASRQAIQDQVERSGGGAVVERQAQPGWHRVRWALPEPAPRVALIVPTRDRLELLRRCVGTVLEITDYPDLELLVVDNRSTEPATLAYLREIAARPRVRVREWDHPYSFAALNNWAVGQVDSPLIGFLNNDIEVTEPGWLREMVGWALRPWVGAVGAKLLYPDGTVQHAGIVTGIGGLAGHPHLGLPGAAGGYFGRAACVQRLSAVTAACLVTRREAFLSVGGFDAAHFGIAFNDVDLGLRLARAGLASVWTPHAVLVHHESASLGPPTSADRRRRFDAEAANLRRIWGAALHDDPAYNPNLTLAGIDFAPAFPPRARRPWRA